MENLINQLNQDIKKVIGQFIAEEKIVENLKKRLTKKEFKYYKLRVEGCSDDVMLDELRCDQKRLEELSKQTLVKLNQEKVKQDILEY